MTVARPGRARACSASPASTWSGRTASSRRPAAGRELGAERGRPVWRFKIRQGVKFHDGAPRRRGRRRDVQPARGPGRGLERALGLQRRADQGQREGDRRHDGRVPRSTRRTATSRTWSARTTTTRSSCPRPTTATRRRRSSAPARSSLESSCRAKARARSRTTTTGTRSALPSADTPSSASTPTSRRASSACSATRSTCSRSSRSSGGKALLTDPDISTLELKASAHRQIHLRTTEPFKDKRVRQAMALLVDRRDLVDGLFDTQVRLRQRQPVRAGVPLDGQTSPQRQQDVAQGQAAARRRGHGGRLPASSSTPGMASRCRSRATHPAERARGGDHDQPEHHRLGHALRRRDVRHLALARLDDGHHRVRPPRRANVLLARRCSPRAPGTAPTSRTRSTTRSSRTTSPPSTSTSSGATAKQIQELLLDESPILFTYFYDSLTGAKNEIANVEVTAMGQFDLSRAGRVKS